MEKSFVRSQSNFIGKTLLTMGLGLLLTFIVAIATPMFIQGISGGVMLVAMVAELALVFYLSARIQKLSVGMARLWFYVYAALNGFTLSIVLSSYATTTSVTVFLFTSAMFFCSAMVGMTTKKDLSMFGQFFMMMLIGLLIIGIFQMFLPMSGLDFFIAVLGIIVFCGLTAYDMQKVKYIHQQSFALGNDEASKYAIIAALGLYLDFINLFFYVLRLFRD